MPFEDATESYVKADRQDIRIRFRRVRGYLPGLIRYWSLHERIYTASLSRELTDLERYLFFEAFHSFQHRIRFVKGHLRKIEGDFSKVEFWSSLLKDKNAILKILETEKNRTMIAVELQILGFNENQSNVLLRAMSEAWLELSPYLTYENGLRDSVALLPKLLNLHERELRNEQILLGKEKKFSPSSKDVLRKIMLVVAGFAMIVSDLEQKVSYDWASVAAGYGLGIHPLVFPESKSSESWADLKGFVKARDPRLKGEIDLMRQHSSSATYSERIREFNESLAKYYLSLPSKHSRQSLLAYLDSMDLNVGNIKEMAAREAKSKIDSYSDIISEEHDEPKDDEKRQSRRL